jgi:hypothetical protein
MGTTRGCARPGPSPTSAVEGTRRVQRPSDAIALVRAVLTDHPEPTGELVIGLDTERRLTGLGIRPRPEEHQVLDTEQLVALADELDAEALVLVSLLADERELLAEADLDGFLALSRACLQRSVLLLDHVLVAGSTWVSMWDAVVGDSAKDELSEERDA